MGMLRGVRRNADTSYSDDGDEHPVLFDEQGRVKVAAAPAGIAPSTGNITANGQSFTIDVTRASNVVLHCKGTFAGSNCTFEGSVDGGATWFGIQAVRTNANTIETTTGVLSAAPAYAWELSVNALTHMRVRATAFTSGTQVWTAILGAYATEPIPAIQTHAVTQSGTFTLTPVAGTAMSAVSTAGTNGSNVKSSAGQVFEITASNPTATAAYVKLYDKASAPTVGTDVPVVTIPVPANSIVSLNFGAIGKRFALGIGRAITGAIGATDTTAAVAGVQLHMTYI